MAEVNLMLRLALQRLREQASIWSRFNKRKKNAFWSL